MGFPGGSDSKESACIAGDPGSILGLGRSPGERNGCLLQYSCLENSRAEAPSRLQSRESQRVGHDWATKQQQEGHPSQKTNDSENKRKKETNAAL